MQFLLGAAIGLGIGFAGAVLFAPERKKRNPWPPHFPGAVARDEAGGNHHDSRGLHGVLDSVRERLREAADEARAAKQKTEREMMERYERTVGRKPKS